MKEKSTVLHRISTAHPKLAVFRLHSPGSNIPDVRSTSALTNPVRTSTAQGLDKIRKSCTVTPDGFGGHRRWPYSLRDGMRTSTTKDLDRRQPDNSYLHEEPLF
ncbi:hypothetical protein MPTK1_8g10810 [Marchantia polymorpha subsp. ruderalis]|uniref:Uncharacterized protein n=1 Tax=Marchantia polymorpha TaxID=3197 RepID=A0A2R6XMX7_MARPO|nr:hypothetical protein MARPO_0008s0141 [Marchantia polymorpha]BBN19455.1 hypothetical protein Mp_8g10810 [Marchantia polymorpha subsp. ruderalis]|eukprot:PTQ47376.1 hypothetical protein MARPO_0008s0141 [Marchantia polymorpha]